MTPTIMFLLFDEYTFVELEKSLEYCLEEKIPVLALVAIIGTTEESAVDPVSHIVAIREKFRKKVP